MRLRHTQVLEGVPIPMGSTRLDFDWPVLDRRVLAYWLGTIAIAIVVFVIATLEWTSHGCVRNLKSEAQIDAVALRTIVEEWRLDHADRADDCPAVSVLKDSGALHADQNMNDPWGHPYRFHCFGDEVSAMSFGPDASRFEDYIWAGRRLF